MQEYVIQIRRTLLQILAWGFFISVGAYFTGFGWRIPGFIMGLFTSGVYFLLMCYRVSKSADMPIHKALLYMRIGWILRLSFIVIMLFMSLKIPVLDFWSAVFGLFTLQIVMFLNGVVIVGKSFFHIT